MSKFSVAGVKPPTIDDSQSENHHLSLKNHHSSNKEFMTFDYEPKEHCVQLT